jgi:hypothetical protein
MNNGSERTPFMMQRHKIVLQNRAKSLLQGIWALPLPAQSMRYFLSGKKI